MSAICGIIHFDGKPVDPADLQQMAESSPFRGPDGVSFHIEGNAGFAHLALHVTPESVDEKQPLASEDGSLVLVADVRLDNREELAGKLAGKSPRKNSLLAGPDSILLMEAFQRWGESCVDHLLGDFVFAVWDREKQELFLARDPLGGYGLSYHSTGPGFIFASETTAILDHKDVQPEIDKYVVAKTLAGLPLDAQESYFSSVRYLAPAHCLRISKDGERVWRYWDIDTNLQVTYRKEEEYTDHFLDLFEKAVECRLRSVGPVGISLSGGYDSTLLAAVAAQVLSKGSDDRQLHSYSYVFDRFQSCDERRYFEPVVAAFGISAHFILADDRLSFSQLSKREIRKDFFWNNCYAQLPEAVALSAQQAGCHNLADGMFGDALFCEPGLFAADLLQKGRIFALFSLLYRYRESMSWYHELVDHGLRQLVPRRVRKTYRRLRPASRQFMNTGLSAHWLDLLSEAEAESEDRVETLGLSPGGKTRYRRIFQAAWAQGFTATRSVPYNRHGIERVSPYFDRRLVEFVMAIPTEQISHPGHPRKLQNNAMRRLLPEETWSRRGKTSMEKLLQEGLEKTGFGLIDKLKSGSQAIDQGYIQRDWLISLVKQPDTSIVNSQALSNFLHLELWLRATDASLTGNTPWHKPFVAANFE